MKAPAFPVAVVMERLQLGDKWQTEKWEAVGVVAFSTESSVRTLLRDESGEQILYPGFEITLHRDECEGYLANLGGEHPKVFVAWRKEACPEQGRGEEVAKPWFVTVSYNEAARLMDGGEQVDGVAMPAEIAAWALPFAQANYRPAPVKIRRKKW